MVALLTPEQYFLSVQSGRGFGLGAVPPDAVQVATTPDQNAAWAAFCTTSADQIEVATGGALHWYNAMRTQFDLLDVPLLQKAASQYGMPTTWTKDLDQQLLDLLTMGDHIVAWLREAADGHRQLVVQGDTWGIASKDSDPFSIRVDETQQPPVPVMWAVDHTVHQTPNGLAAGPLIVGGVAIPWVIVGLGMVGVIAVAAGAIYLVYLALRTLGDAIQGLINYWNSKTWSECVQKVQDPSLCVKALEGMKNLQVAQNEAKPPSPGDEAAKLAKAFSDAAQTVLWVGIGGGLLYLGVKYGPTLAEEAKAAWASREASRSLVPARAGNPVARRPRALTERQEAAIEKAITETILALGATETSGDDWTSMYPYEIETRAGRLLLHPRGTTLFGRFVDPALAVSKRVTWVNEHTGKWNHHGIGRTPAEASEHTQHALAPLLG